MKQYQATWLYVIKIFGLLVSAMFCVFIISLFLDIIAIFMKSSFFEKFIGIVGSILFLLSAFLIIRSNNPSIGFADTYMRIGTQQVNYDQIKDFYPSRGASEPYIITKNDHKIDLEVSWFRKQDRIEIEKTILEKIELFTKQV